MRIHTFFLFLLTPLFLQANDLSPWFGPDKLPEFRCCYLYRHYPRVSTGSHLAKHVGNDQFVDAGISFSPAPEWSAEFEVISAATTERSFGLDTLRLTGRYRLLDDVVDLATVSLVVGLVADYASRAALRDIGSFHHGRGEFEAFLSAGRELALCEEFWTSRIWGMVGVGLADMGSPWTHLLVKFEKNHYDLHRYGLFLEGLWGFGNHDLHLHREFRGYGPIRHRSFDLGIQYQYFWSELGWIGLSYAYRIWAKNFPAEAHTVEVCVNIPFNL